MRKPYLIAGIIILPLLGGLFGYFVLADRDSDSEPSATDVTTETEDSPELTENQPTEADPDVTPRPEEGEPVKEPVVVNQVPVVFTGFGHSPDNPLPVGQLTSTTCTTDPGVECTIELLREPEVGVIGPSSITFDPKTTNFDGVAIWEWTGGQEVTTGTWSVVARAGDKVSGTEVIYVQ